MRGILTFIYAICFLMSVLLLQGCSQEGIIGKKTMAAIVEEMFIADQYLDKTPDMLAQTDSLSVYPAILAKYGYTVEDYRNSIEYWLQEGGEYNNILKAAQKSMEEKVDRLDILVQKARNEKKSLDKWWALDSVRKVEPVELLYDPLLRGVRWLVVPGERLQKWNMLDSAVVDIPQNPVWWQNNMVAPERKFNTFMVRKEVEKPKVKPRRSVRRTDAERKTVRNRRLR